MRSLTPISRVSSISAQGERGPPPPRLAPEDELEEELELLDELELLLELEDEELEVDDELLEPGVATLTAVVLAETLPTAS